MQFTHGHDVGEVIGQCQTLRKGRTNFYLSEPETFWRPSLKMWTWDVQTLYKLWKTKCETHIAAKKRNCETREIQRKFCDTHVLFWRTIRHYYMYYMCLHNAPLAKILTSCQPKCQVYARVLRDSNSLWSQPALSKAWQLILTTDGWLFISWRQNSKTTQRGFLIVQNAKSWPKR